MKITESRVAGYEARVIELAENERFVLRHPKNRRDVLSVNQVVAFDSGPNTDQPYYRVLGREIGGGREREMDFDFTDVGKLPPHVRRAVGGCPQDHSPADRNGYAAARRARQNLQAAVSRAATGERSPLAPDELAQLRRRYGVSGEIARSYRWSQATLDARRNRAHGIR